MARATNDLNAVRMMLGPGIMYWTETVLTLVLAIAIMLTVDWRLTLMALAAGARGESRRRDSSGAAFTTRFEQIQEMFSDISSRVQENLAGVRMIRAYVQEEAEMREIRGTESRSTSRRTSGWRGFRACSCRCCKR